MYKTCLKNGILLRENYECILCHCKISGLDFDSVLQHLSLNTHRDKINTIDESIRKQQSEKVSAISENLRKEIVENHVACTKIPTTFRCHLCKLQVDDLQTIIGHIKGTKHREKLKITKKSQEKKVFQTSSSKAKTNRGIVQTHKTSHDMKVLENYILSDQRPNFFKCSLCNCKISGQENILPHVKGNFHQGLLSAKKTKPNNLDCQESKSHDTTGQNNSNYLDEIKSQFNHASENCDYSKKFKSLNDNESDDCCYLEEPKSDNANDVNNCNDIKQIESNSTNNNKSVEYRNVQETKSQTVLIERPYCSPCEMYLENATQVQCHVMFHLHKEYNIKPDIDIMKFNLNEDKVVVECLLCHSFISNKNLYKHLQTKLHSRRLNLFSSVKHHFKLDNFIVVQVEKHDLIEKTFDTGRDLSNTLHCAPCNVSVQEKDKQTHLLENEHKRNALERCTTTSTGIKISDISCYFCFICELSFSNIPSLQRHYNSYEHQLKIKCLQMISECPYIEFINVKDKQIIRCKLCKILIQNSLSIGNHLSGKKHSELYREISDKPSSDNKENIKTLNNNEKKHAINTIVPLNKEKIKIAGENLSNVHVLTVKATGKRNEFETSSEELINLGFSPNNIESLTAPKSNSIDNALNKLVNLDHNESGRRIRKRRIPNIEQTKKFSFEKNVSIFGESYIKFCIYPGLQNIYYIDPEKIRLMELGITLTIPSESQRICLPCGLTIPDNAQLLFEHLQTRDHLENLCEMENSSKLFEKYPDQFSDLKLAKFYMKESSENLVQCFVCGIEIENDNFLIHSHINNVNHIAKSRIWTESSNEVITHYTNILKNIWYYAQLFVCEICNKKFDMEIEFVIHLQTADHNRKINLLIQRKNCILQFDGCSVCVTYWYGELDSYILHCEHPYHKRFANNGDLMVPDMITTALEFLDEVDEKVNNIVKESDKLIQEKQNEIDLLAEIKNTVKPHYPNAEAYIFGSRLSNLGFLDSDVDVFLDCDNVYCKSTTQEQSQHYLKSVKKYFDNEQDIWIVEELLLVTRVPIIKLRHIPTALKCDISFINGLSVEKSRLIGLYNSAFPICRKLILYLKKWLSLCQIFGSDCITTYAISWYVIFYLQINSILPTVHDLIQQRNEPKFVDGWECGFPDIIHSGNSEKTFREHLKGFFTYYADFDYLKNVVCPYIGKVIEKRNFVQSDKLPKGMENYKERLKKDQLLIFRFDSPMCIQDPVDLSQNMTKAVKKQQLRCFRQYCKESSKRL